MTCNETLWEVLTQPAKTQCGSSYALNGRISRALFVHVGVAGGLLCQTEIRGQHPTAREDHPSDWPRRVRANSSTRYYAADKNSGPCGHCLAHSNTIVSLRSAHTVGFALSYVASSNLQTWSPSAPTPVSYPWSFLERHSWSPGHSWSHCSQYFRLYFSLASELQLALLASALRPQGASLLDSKGSESPRGTSPP